MEAPAASARRLTRRELWWRLLLYPGHTLPTAAAPIVIAAGLAYHDRVFALVPMLLAFLGSWLVHLAGVLTDNLTLLVRYPALPEHPELLEAVADRRLVLSTLREAIALCLVLALAIGAFLVSVGGPVALATGVVGTAASLAYHGRLCAYAPRGWAEPVFFVMFGIVAVAATYYIQSAWLTAGAAPWLARRAFVPVTALLVGLPMGALVTSVLTIDDLRDREWDAAKGWRTPTVRWGAGWGRMEFRLLVLAAYAAPPWIDRSLGFGHAVLLPLLTAPVALIAIRAVGRPDPARTLRPWSARMSGVALLYSSLLAVGLAASA